MYHIFLKIIFVFLLPEYLSITCMQCPWRQKRAPDLLELKFKMVLQ